MKVPSFELQVRVARLQDHLRAQGIDGALLVQRADTLYYSGTAQNVHLYIPQAGRPLVLAYRDFARAQAESSWGVVPLTGLSKLPEFIAGAGNPLPNVLGLEFDVLPVSQFERYRRLWPEAAFRDISAAIRHQRAVKSDWELERLKEAAEIYPQLLIYARGVLRPGMTELELEGLLEGKARALGHGGFVRTRGFGSEFHFGAVTAGARAAVAGAFDGPVVGAGLSPEHPGGASVAGIAEGEPIIVDTVSVVRGYQIDQTRMFVLGRLSPELTEAYRVACEIEERLRRLLVPGRVAGQVYEEVLTWVKDNTPYAENFMGFAHSRVSFVGHGVGLELDELPTISRGAKDTLVPGMVIAIEPKFVFPGVGVVGIEDTVLVEGSAGASFLSKAPRELQIVETDGDAGGQKVDEALR
ncbi:putative peptidase [Peptococcaceae bacterium CEB3]|nr:putative peptidase [Peptococcaceae bacterium CEB3]